MNKSQDYAFTFLKKFLGKKGVLRCSHLNCGSPCVQFRGVRVDSMEKTTMVNGSTIFVTLDNPNERIRVRLFFRCDAGHIFVIHLMYTEHSTVSVIADIGPSKTELRELQERFEE